MTMLFHTDYRITPACSACCTVEPAIFSCTSNRQLTAHPATNKLMNWTNDSSCWHRSAKWIERTIGLAGTKQCKTMKCTLNGQTGGMCKAGGVGRTWAGARKNCKLKSNEHPTETQRILAQRKSRIALIICCKHRKANRHPTNIKHITLKQKEALNKPFDHLWASCYIA